MTSIPEPRPDGSALERLRVLISLGEAVEKLVRLQQVLGRQRLFVDAREQESGYAGVIDPLLLVLNGQAETLGRNSARISSLIRGEALDEGQRIALAGIIQTVINVVLTLHELLVLLPREAPEPQVFRVLRDCFKDEWRNTSVIMTNALASYEYRIEDVLEKLEDIGQHELTRYKGLLKGFTRAGSVPAQAFVDRSNPLAWPVLAHEYGHALDEARGISKRLIYGSEAEDRTSSKEFLVKWVSEVFADFVAARVLGPASLVPFLLLEMTRSSLPKGLEEVKSHPPANLRLALVREYMNRLGVATDEFEGVFALYEFDYARKLTALDETEREAKDQREEPIGTFLRSNFTTIASEVDSLGLRPFGQRQLENAKELQKKLQFDLPISSLRYTKDDQILSELNSLVGSKSAPGRVYEVLSNFNETPATSSEILTAGWLYKLASYEEHLKESFSAAASPTSASLNGYGDYLARTDELLLRSIELAAVHAAIVQG
jgi:hypothetical protein